MTALHLPRLRRPVLTVGHVRCLIVLAALALDAVIVWLVRLALG